MLKILPDNEFESKGKVEIFDEVPECAKDYVKHSGDNVRPVHIFFSDSGSTSKSHLVKVIYGAVSKNLLYRCDDTEKSRVLLLGPTGISMVSIHGNTIRSGFEINLEQN